MNGRLFTSNIQGLANLKVPARKILITRAGPEVSGSIRDRVLSPSNKLFTKYLSDWKNQMDPDIWWPKYENQFSKQFKNEEMIKHLRMIYKLLISGENVVVICYCRDWHYCHRRLIGEFFKKYGIRVKELSPIRSKQTWLDI